MRYKYSLKSIGSTIPYEFMMLSKKPDCGLFRCLLFLNALMVGLVLPNSYSFGDWRDDIGYTKLIQILGASAPNGSGVPISIVEATGPDSEAYFPNVTNSEFSTLNDPAGEEVVFIDGSNGQARGVSGHSNAQAERFFGNTLSVSPAANEVTVYEANNYLTNILNMNNSNNTVPDAQNFRVQNFSWIGTFAESGNPTPNELNEDREALRRFDYAIDVNNISAFVGLQNAENPLPRLLTHSYNSTTVGRSIGGHGVGLTHFEGYGVGRSKPELVAPLTTSSAATAAASSVATFLHSSDTVIGTDAANSPTMKAILLAGATKAEFPTWSQVDAGGDWHPLDDTFGAGQVNLFNSYLTTLGGRFAGDTATPVLVGSHGWDYQEVQPGAGNELLYSFEIPTGSIAEELSIALAWNAKISAPFNTGDPVVANLALELVDSNGMTIDYDVEDNLVEGLSDSDVDNLEHLYLKNLPAGTYTLKVSSDDLASEFGLAWRTSTVFDSSTADFDDDGDVDGADILSWQRGYGTLINAPHVQGDADGDGDVDADDLAIIARSFAGGAIAFRSSINTIPEPNSWLIVAIAVMLICWRRAILRSVNRSYSPQ